jgi:uncharacterized membrane protein
VSLNFFNRLFSKRKASIFSDEETALIMQAIKEAEQSTSGEVRVYVENKCKYLNPVERAKDVFQDLNMHVTAERNGVLLYIAIKDRQLAIWGDEGIHAKLGNLYWEQQVKKLVAEFNASNFAVGIASCVKAIGESLAKYFPYKGDADKNELSDEIVFGK